jgi:pseudouridine kinase
MRALHARDVDLVWVRLGSRGSLLSQGRSLAVLDAVDALVVDVTGAGDAMTAAYCHALVSGGSPVEAATLGHRAAALTVASALTVRPDLREALGA